MTKFTEAPDASRLTLPEKFILGLQLMGFFCKIGCFTFGGGWSIVAQIQREFVDKRHWMTEADLLDMVAVGRSLPGTMIGNVSYLFGYHLGGIFCGVCSTVGMLIPPMVILSIITFFYNSFRDNLYVSRAMVGVRATVAPIIGGACLSLRKSAYPDKLAYVLTAIALVLAVFTSTSTIAIVLLGAAAGLLITTIRRRCKEVAR